MAEIKNERPLTLERLKEALSYDAETGIFTWKTFGGPRATIGTVAGAIRKRGYRLICIDGGQYKASRLAWLYVYGEWPEGYLDHINGIKHDDRLSNLRKATIADNSANKVGTGPSGVKGVYKTSCGKFYQVSIMRHGKQKYLGTYKTLEEAAAVRKAAALEIHGVFALENRE